MRILIVDDQAQARDSLIRLCERNEDIEVVSVIDPMVKLVLANFEDKHIGLIGTKRWD